MFAPTGSFIMPKAEPTLEDRIRAIEDRLAIYNLIASHPPSADTAADYYTRAVYAEDGVFDRDPHPGGHGNEEIAAMVRSPAHAVAISGGLAHFCGLPYIELDGDTASVTSYLQILMPDPNGAPVDLSNHGTSKGFRIHRVAANRWDLARTPTGWRIKRRTLRPLDGSEGARQLLRQALKPFEATA
jgi:SnoaL-like domain